MAAEFTLETLTKEKVIETIEDWGNTVSHEYSGNPQDVIDFEQEIQAIVGWIKQHVQP